MQPRDGKENRLRYILYDGSRFYELKDAKRFLDLDTEIIQNTYMIHYEQIMNHTFLEESVNCGFIIEDDIEEVAGFLEWFPLDSMLFTQEFLEMVLVDRIGHEEFIRLKEELEQEFIRSVMDAFTIPH